MNQPLNHYSSEKFAQREMRNADYLAFRAVAESGLLQNMRVLDIGCGAGRCSRFLRSLGNEVHGVDCNPRMIAQAVTHDPAGNYQLVDQIKTKLPFEDQSFDGLFSSWMLLEMGDTDQILNLLRECKRVLKPGGTAVFVSNTENFYSGNWISCKNDYPENKLPLRSGQVVKALLIPEEIEVTDYFWSDEDYRSFFTTAGFEVTKRELPLGRAEDDLPWKDELHHAVYAIHYLQAGNESE